MTKCSKFTLFSKIGPKFTLFSKIGPKFTLFSKIGSKFIIAFCSKIGPKISNILSMEDEVTISPNGEVVHSGQMEPRDPIFPLPWDLPERRLSSVPPIAKVV